MYMCNRLVQSALGLAVGVKKNIFLQVMNNQAQSWLTIAQRYHPLSLACINNSLRCYKVEGGAQNHPKYNFGMALGQFE